MASSWRSLPCKISELRLDITLNGGQSFRWKEIQKGTWRSILAGKIWTLQQNDTEILYQVHDESCPTVKSLFGLTENDIDDDFSGKERNDIGNRKRTRLASSKQSARSIKQKSAEIPTFEAENHARYATVLKEYFQLGISLVDLYETWKESDEHFKTLSSNFPGVRVLRQDPTENLFSFICSSNNNITRITSMVEKLCSFYGERLGVVDGVVWYSFPSTKSLAQDGVEERLRKAGFGYRAKFIHQAAKSIVEKPDGWLGSLRKMEYEKTHAELTSLPGVGAKVADCVCLMSMDKPNAVPVDTHVWQIAARDYMPSLSQSKTLTAKVYRDIAAFFRSLFGEYAGWAHSVLFSADLKKFQVNTEEESSDKEKQSGKRSSEETKEDKRKTKGHKNKKRR